MRFIRVLRTYELKKVDNHGFLNGEHNFAKEEETSHVHQSIIPWIWSRWL